MSVKYESTKDIKVSSSVVDQIIGQDEAVRIIKKAAKQRRHVLLIGDPGTGKSLLGQATAELLPKERLADILSFPNPSDDNVPVVSSVPRGEGKVIVSRAKIQSMSSFKNQGILMFLLVIVASLLPYYFWRKGFISDVIYAASMITGMVFIVGFLIFLNLNKRVRNSSVAVPRLLVDNSDKSNVPFVDATGAHAGALLGDVLHDPLQSLLGSNNISHVHVSYGKTKTVQLQQSKIMDKVDDLLNKKEIIRKGTYKATFLGKNELNVLAEKQGVIEPVEVLSVNKYYRKGNLIKIATQSGRELIVTPEHKVAIKSFLNKIRYVRADKIRSWHRLVVFDP